LAGCPSPQPPAEQHFPIVTQIGERTQYTYRNDWTCTKEPGYAQASKAEGFVEVKDAFKLGGTYQSKIERLTTTRAPFEEVEAAFFDICEDYGTGKILKDEYDLDRRAYNEIRKHVIDPTMGATTQPPPSVAEIRVNRQDSSRVIPTGEKVDDGGIFRIDLDAPNPTDTITSVDYECQGYVCGHVYVCPNGGKCGNHLREFEINASKASFYAWSNSAAPGIFIFKIHYRPN
jgi:hypothetical protein